MLFIKFLITIFFINVCSELQHSFSHKKRQDIDAGSIQDLSKNIQQESIGFLPIGEIIRKANLPYFMHSTPEEGSIKNTSEETVTLKINVTKHISKTPIEKILLEGSKNDIMKLPYRKVIKNLRLIDKMNLSLVNKLLIWDIIKEGKKINEMDRTYLENLYGLLYNIPENDFIYFNTNDWDVVDFFGTSKLLSRRQAAIIAYAMKYFHGAIIIQDSKFINKLKGLICGFSQTDLKNISTTTFRGIHQSVFANLWPCTREQMIVLLNTAQKSEVYGPFELWNDEIIKRMGLLITIIEIKDFNRFYLKAFNGLEPDIIKCMSSDQHQWLIQRKLGFKNENLLNAYKLKIKNKNSSRITLSFHNCNFVIVILMHLYIN